MSIRHIEAVFKNAELKPTSKLVALALADHADNETGECFPSIALMMKKTSLSKQAVISAIKNLENLGYLKVKRDPIPCRKNRYWLSAGSLLAKRWRKEDQENSDHRVKEIDQLNTCVVKEVDPLGLGDRPNEDASGQGDRPVRSRSLTNRVKEVDPLGLGDRPKQVKEVDPLGLGDRPKQVKEVDPNHHNRHINHQKEPSFNHQSETENFESNYQEDIYSSEIDEDDDWTLPEEEGEEGGEDLSYDFGQEENQEQEVKKVDDPKPIDLSAIGLAIVETAPKIGLTEDEWEESRYTAKRSLEALQAQVDKEAVEW